MGDKRRYGVRCIRRPRRTWIQQVGEGTPACWRQMWQSAEERGHRGESSQRTTTMRHDDDDDADVYETSHDRRCREWGGAVDGHLSSRLGHSGGTPLAK